MVTVRQISSILRFDDKTRGLFGFETHSASSPFRFHINMFE